MQICKGGVHHARPDPCKLQMSCDNPEGNSDGFKRAAHVKRIRVSHLKQVEETNEVQMKDSYIICFSFFPSQWECHSLSNPLKGSAQACVTNAKNTERSTRSDGHTTFWMTDTQNWVFLKWKKAKPGAERCQRSESFGRASLRQLQ